MASSHHYLSKGAALDAAGARVEHHHYLALACAACLSSVQLPALAADQSGREGDQRVGALEEVVVTARKRDESLRDVPVAVSVLSAARLEEANVVSGKDLLGTVPNLYFTDTGGRSSESRFTMRGVGVRSPLETSVAVFVDGVYMPTVGWDMEFLEVQRLEVLRGPQGALFGRNTQAGAINIVTAAPAGELGGRFRVDFDEFDTARGDLYVSGPLSDAVSFSVAALGETTDGYIKNITLRQDALERDKYGGRVALRLEPSDRLDATLYVDGVFQEGGYYAQGEPLGTQPNAVGPHEVTNDQAPYEDVENYGGALSVNFAMGSTTLSSITGVRRVTSLSLSDRDNIDTPDRDGLPPMNIPPSIRGGDFPPPSGNYNVVGRTQSLLSQELRLASSEPGSLKWLVGLYGFLEENDASRELRMEDSFRFPNPTNFLSDLAQQDRDGYALFGQASYDASDRLELTLGGRYTSEHVEQDLRIAFLVGGGAIQNSFSDRPEKDFSSFTPSGSVAFRWNDDLMTYLSVAQGFKGGGFNLVGPMNIAGNASFDDEYSLMYELGAKSAFLDRRLTVDAALFWIDTTDMQVTTTVVTAGSIVTQATTNAAKARSKGAELEIAALPLPGLTLRSSVGYIDAEYVDYVVSPTLDLSGRPIEEIPDWTGSLSADYTVALSQKLDLTFGALYRYVGGNLRGRGTPETPHLRVDSYDSTDVRVELRSRRWDLTLYAQNVFDDYNIVDKAIQADFVRVPGLDGTQRAEPPRRVGLRAAFRF